MANAFNRRDHGGLTQRAAEYDFDLQFLRSFRINPAFYVEKETYSPRISFGGPIV